MIYDTIIIGSGPAGLMTAVQLEKANISYILIEKNSEVGKKLLITGNKRCNVTNNLNVDDFINSLTIPNKKFLYPALYTFGPAEIIQYFKDNNLELILENDFKYFPETNKSKSVLDKLLLNIDNNKIKLNQDIVSVTKTNKLFTVKTKTTEFQSEHVIIATGSASFPATGSTGFGLKVAKHFSIKYDEFTPAETHIYSDYIVTYFGDLQGTSIAGTTVKIKNTSVSNTGDLLFTHFGLSGPAIYHLSEYVYDESKIQKVVLQFALTTKSEQEVLELLSQSNIHILKQLESIVSKRVARKLLHFLKIENTKISEISKKNLQNILDFLFRFEVPVTRVESKEKSYVNKGGIDITELNPSTMESQKVKGLYFIGETVNIHGPIGGYNITIAFSTGFLAALHIIESKQ